MTQTTRIPGKGTLLISEPFLADPNFKRTVVLLAEHNAQGSIGFILNRPLEFKLNHLVGNFPKFDATVFLGGPVQQDSLHFIHKVRGLADPEDEVIPGVYWGGDFGRLKAMVAKGEVTPDDIRFFMGYSGWGPKQLEEEMKAKTWIISKTKAGFAFADQPTGLWQEILIAMGGKFKALSNFPEDPSLN